MFGGKLVSFDEAKIAGRAGRRRAPSRSTTRPSPSSPTRGGARRPRSTRCRSSGTKAPARRASSATIAEHLKEGLTAPSAYAMRNEGDALKAIAGAREEGRGRLSHAVPRARDDGADELHGADHRRTGPKCGSPTQNGEASLAALSEASGLPLEKCEVYKHILGGGFGRRGGAQDYVRQAVAIAQAVSRRPDQDDLEPRRGHDARLLPADLAVPGGGRPRRERQARRPARARVRASRSTRSSIRRRRRTARTTASCRATTQKPGDAQLGYTVPNLLIEYAMRNTHVPVGPWRGVNTNQNAVYMECFIDEVARAAGTDPVEFRRALMQKHPKHLAVLNAAAAKADWGKPLPAGRASRRRAVHGLRQLFGGGRRGVGERQGQGQGAPDGARRSNCGHAVNPDQIAAQVEGSVAYGLSARRSTASAPSTRAASSETNFHTYEILRLAEMPKVETVIVPTLRLLGRRRRADDLRRRARGAERDRRGDRQAGAQPAAQAHADGVTAASRTEAMRPNTGGPRRRRSQRAQRGDSRWRWRSARDGTRRGKRADPPASAAIDLRSRRRRHSRAARRRRRATPRGDGASIVARDPRELRAVSCGSRCRGPLRRRCRAVARRRRRAA